MEEAVLQMRTELHKTRVEEMKNAKGEKYAVVALGLSWMLFIIVGILMN